MPDHWMPGVASAGQTLGLSRENGNYYSRLGYVFIVYIGIMEKKMEATII